MSLWQPSWCLILDNFLGQKTADDDDNPSNVQPYTCVTLVHRKLEGPKLN